MDCGSLWIGRLRHWGVCGLAVALWLAPTVDADERPFVRGERLADVLARPVGFQIAGDPRRDTLERIGDQFQISLFLDRRVDPDARVVYRTRDAPLTTAIENMLTPWGTAISWLGPIGYIGPSDDLEKLQTVRAVCREQIDRLPSPIRKQLSQERPLDWERLATPQGIVERISTDYGIEWKNLERLPHDLWAAGHLPSTDLATQLTLLLFGFDLTFRYDEATGVFEIVSIPPRVRLRRTYPVEVSRHRQTIANWQQRFPDAEIQSAEGSLILNARVEDHWRLDPKSRPKDVLVKKTAVREAGGTQVYTLRVDAPLEAILTTICRQTGLKLKLHRQAIDAAEIDLAQLVRLDVHQVTLDALLTELLKPASLGFRLEEDRLTVSPAAE